MGRAGGVGAGCEVVHPCAESGGVADAAVPDGLVGWVGAGEASGGGGGGVRVVEWLMEGWMIGWVDGWLGWGR